MIGVMKAKKRPPELAVPSLTPVPPQTPTPLRPKPGKPENLFSPPRDRRENRGTQQKKTSYHAQSFFRPRGNF
jgi:hypothetical protein